MQEKISKILLPFDGSHHSLNALDHAIFFARHFNAIIMGLYVDSISAKTNSQIQNNVVSASLIQHLFNQAKSKSAQAGIDFQSEIITGDTKDSILEYAQRWGYHLIIMGSAGAGQSPENYLGSIANEILKNAKVPVLIVK